MQAEVIQKKEGFKGQKAIVIPRTVLNKLCTKDPVVSNLFITDIGYYPKAFFHHRNRPNGAEQHILIYCHEGFGEVLLQNKKYIIQPGEFFILPMKVPHTYAAADKNPWTIFWVHFKGTVSQDIVSRFMEKANGHKDFIGHPEKPIALFNEIYTQLEKGYGKSNILFSSMSFWNLLNAFINNEHYSSLRKSQQRHDSELSIDLMRKNIAKTLTIDEMASHVNRSPSHFAFLFKQKTGFAPIEYFNHLKVQEACQYLLFTDMRIREIAYNLGIDDPYYFTRMFTKIIGMSPKEYRLRRID